jgi:Aspartyl protease
VTAAVAVIAALVMAFVLVSCSQSSGPKTAVGLPSLKTGCSSGQSSPMQSIPFSEATSGSGKLAIFSVCVNGSGPYPFLLSTGSGTSVIAPTLAQSLNLSNKTSNVPVAGVSCVSTTSKVQVQNWSFGGVTLAPQSLLVATVPGVPNGQEPLGMIGSDVLSRFGAIGVDYANKKLVIAHSEGPAATGNQIVLGQASSSPPAGLIAGSPAPKVGAPVRVIVSTTATQVVAAVSFTKQTEQFAVDSGSASSSVSSSVASSLSLPAAGQGSLSGIGCSGSGPAVSSGSWALGDSPLPSTTLVSRSFSGAINQQTGGALGSDVLSSYGSVVLDYAAAHLWLGGG